MAMKKVIINGPTKERMMKRVSFFISKVFRRFLVVSSIGFYAPIGKITYSKAKNTQAVLIERILLTQEMKK